MKNNYRWNRPHMVAIRIILLPVAFILHLFPHIIGLTVTLYRWVRYGGEFIVYNNDDRHSMAKVFEELKKRDDLITNPKIDSVNPIPNYLENGLEKFFKASKEFNDGYKNENGNITRINIATLSAALSQAETELKKCFNRYKAHIENKKEVNNATN